MTVPQGNVRFSCNVRRIRSSVSLRPTFEDDETWCCGTAIAVPYVKLHKALGVTVYYNRLYGHTERACCKMNCNTPQN